MKSEVGALYLYPMGSIYVCWVIGKSGLT